MKEHDFVQLLQERARTQRKELEAVPFPNLFSFILVWLSNHPWRFLIPLAFIISLVLRGIVGHAYTEFVLGVFKGI